MIDHQKTEDRKPQRMKEKEEKEWKMGRRWMTKRILLRERMTKMEGDIHLRRQPEQDL